MQGFSFLDPVVGALVLLAVFVFLMVGTPLGGKLVKICLDIMTARKIWYETRKLQHEQKTRESPIHRPTAEDVRKYDPKIRELEDRERAERRRRWFDGLQGIVALLAALREMLDRIRNLRRRGAPPDDEKI